MTLDLTPSEWSAAAHGADSTAYCGVAENVAAGKGVVATIPGSSPPQTKPFLFWGPGAPVVLGWWLKLVGGRTMFTFFLFAVVAQFFAGAIAVATAALWTRSTIALSLVAFASGYCPPVQDHLLRRASDVVGNRRLAVSGDAVFCAEQSVSGVARATPRTKVARRMRAGSPSVQADLAVAFIRWHEPTRLALVCAGRGVDWHQFGVAGLHARVRPVRGGVSRHASCSRRSAKVARCDCGRIRRAGG